MRTSFFNINDTPAVHSPLHFALFDTRHIPLFSASVMFRYFIIILLPKKRYCIHGHYLCNPSPQHVMMTAYENEHETSTVKKTPYFIANKFFVLNGNTIYCCITFVHRRESTKSYNISKQSKYKNTFRTTGTRFLQNPQTQN